MARVFPFAHRELAIKTGREENAFRVGVEENLLRVKAMQLRDGLSRHGVRVVASITHFCDWNPTVPNPPRLVPQKIEAKSQERVHQIVRGIQQQRYAFRMLRVNGEVERLLLVDPSGPKG